MNGNWEWLTLDDVLIQQANRKKVQQGWSPKCHAFPAAPGQWGVLKTTAIQAGRFEPEHNKALPDHLAPKPGIEIESGDLLVTCAGPRSRCGVPTLVRSTPQRLMMSGKMYRFRADDRLAPRFLELWLLSPDAQRQIDAMKTGISDSGLNLTHGRFTRLPVPVPPLAEQHRIVDLLEDHLSRLDAAESLVRTSLRRLTSLRQSALSDFHDGDLTPLGELAVDSGYGTSEKCVPDGPGPAVVRIPNLMNGRIDLFDEKRIASASADVARYRLAPGDLLIVRTNGSVDLIGRSAVVQDGVDAAFASYLIRYQLRLDRVIPEWAQAMLSTPQVRAKIETLAASSAGQHNLSLGKLNPLELPIPTLTVQAARLGRLADVDGKISRLRAELSAAESRGVNLRRSLLAAAFAGRLTDSASKPPAVEEILNA